MNDGINKSNRISPAYVFFLLVFLFDILLVILCIQGYYFVFLKSTGAIIPVLLSLVAFYVLASHRKMKKLWVILVFVFGLPMLGLLSVINVIMDQSYATVKSPTGGEVLVIEHRNATLGETTHFYNFYRKTAFPGIMNKLNKKTVEIMTRGTADRDLEVLGINNAVWVDGEYVIFRSGTKVEFTNSRKKYKQEASEIKGTFVPKETDVIQLGEKVQNTKVMDEFIKNSESGLESEIRYVFLKKQNVPIAVYTLKSRADTKAGQKWIEISRDHSFDSGGYNLIQPQQCSSVSKDTDRGFYYLTECFHTWEIKLMPIN